MNLHDIRPNDLDRLLNWCIDQFPNDWSWRIHTSGVSLEWKPGYTSDWRILGDYEFRNFMREMNKHEPT